MTITINRSNYIDLLNEVQLVPKLIETELEYDLFLSVTESLLSKRQSRTPEETALFMLLVKLIEDYEQEHYSLQPSAQIAPHKFLQHMMEARNMEATDLMGLLNISKELALSIFDGDRQIDTAQSQYLGNYFNVSFSNFCYLTRAEKGDLS
jgi:HTH-type transcriptional regulator / antitoxin HigA